MALWFPRYLIIQLLLFSSFTIDSSLSLKILNVWTPDVIKNGTQNSALVDCDYTLDMRDLDSLEVKWYFRYDPTPIYTWVPPNPPQVDERFARHINLNYEISNDEYMKHRALNLQGLSTELSGRYSCRVSSIYEDEFKSRDLIIYAPAMQTGLDVGWVTQTKLNVTCSAKRIYPEPIIKISITVPMIAEQNVDVSDEASRTLVWSEGAFSATMSKLVEFPNNAEMMQILIGGGEEDAFEARSGMDFGDSITENPRIFPGASHPIVRCEFTLPGTPYRELRWKKVPPLPFLNNSESTNVRLGPVILVIFVSMIFQCQIK